ncbi:hypothetical protein ACKW6Q_00965 [Chryseobacterium kwangjuense]|uniref:Transposase n=1 Tax=Chryseobacterium kwangjuense TaxID=267125 RepID=A0ABW9K0G8_9FLAO
MKRLIKSQNRSLQTSITSVFQLLASFLFCQKKWFYPEIRLIYYLCLSKPKQIIM